jgi:hypothetical protein
LTSISRTVRRWALHHRSDKSLQDLAAMYNPCIRDWINYYSHFYKTQLRPNLKRIDLYVIRWARRSSSGCVGRPREREKDTRTGRKPVNPDGIRNQIEGGILQSASWTLY